MTQDDTVIRLSEVRMEKVGKRYGAAWAVKDVSISIRPGEFYRGPTRGGSSWTTSPSTPCRRGSETWAWFSSSTRSGRT